MNKKDAAVYKSLAELGFDFGNKEIPDPTKDEIVKSLSDPNIRNLDDMCRVLGLDHYDVDELLTKQNDTSDQKLPDNQEKS